MILSHIQDDIVSLQVKATKSLFKLRCYSYVFFDTPSIGEVSFQIGATVLLEIKKLFLTCESASNNLYPFYQK